MRGERHSPTPSPSSSHSLLRQTKTAVTLAFMFAISRHPSRPPFHSPVLSHTQADTGTQDRARSRAVAAAARAIPALAGSRRHPSQNFVQPAAATSVCGRALPAKAKAAGEAGTRGPVFGFEGGWEAIAAPPPWRRTSSV